VVAALSAWHERHEEAARALHEVVALPAHVALEAYCVLTRLPAGLAVPAATAARVLSERFSDPPLQLADEERRSLLDTLAAAGISGGSGYDALIALEAAAHERTLLTLDERAQRTYRRLGVAFCAVAA